MTRIVKSLVLFIVLAFTMTLLTTSLATTYLQRNARDEYRWPWRYGETWSITQGQNGPVSHFDYHPTTGAYVGLGSAVDFATTYGNAPVWAAREGVAHCENHDGNKMGVAVKVVHGSDSDLYAHANDCPFAWGTYINVAQGNHISYTGTRRTLTTFVGDHVHFQRNSAGTGGEGTPQIAVSFTMEGKSSFLHSIEYGNTAVSDNLGAGYTVPVGGAVQWEPAIHDKAVSLSWSTAGATASIPLFTPGRSPATTCGFGGATPGWYQCNFTDVNGASRAGRVQTFKGAGTPDGQHAIFKDSSSSFAVFMSRGLLGPYTDTWATGKDGMYYLGYPVNDGGGIGGTIWQMNFENGYATYDWSNCVSRWFWWSNYLGGYVEASLPYEWCD
ncbi:MAG: hypothetical protein ACR2HN_08000 [Tepidiformaceae bacterium]